MCSSSGHPPASPLAHSLTWLDSHRYQSQQDALERGLYSVNEQTQVVTLSVDTTNVYPANMSEGGRPSIRIESKQAVNKGLVIGDFAHMPGSVCGSWPACTFCPCPVLSCPLHLSLTSTARGGFFSI